LQNPDEQKANQDRWI
jgi:hypothetical protein